MNIRGFGNEAKQRSVFDFAKNSRSDLFTRKFSDETKCDTVDKSFWSPALGKQGGVAILVAENTDFKCLQWKKDSSGRIVSVLTELDDTKITLVKLKLKLWLSLRRRCRMR